VALAAMACAISTLAMASLPRQPLLLSIALSSSYSSRLNLHQFNLPKPHGGISFNSIRGGSSGSSVPVGASVGHVEVSVAPGDAETASGDLKF